MQLYAVATNPAERVIVARFKSAGAVSPATALPGRELTVDGPAFDRLITRGVIREGAPGTFYLFEAPPSKNRLLKSVLFWLVLILFPMAVMQFCNGSPTR